MSVLISFLNFLLLCAPTILLLANIFSNYLIVFASLCPLRCLNIHFGELIVYNSFFVRHYSTFLVTFFVLQRTLLIYIIVLFATFSFLFSNYSIPANKQFIFHLYVRPYLTILNPSIIFRRTKMLIHFNLFATITAKQVRKKKNGEQVAIKHLICSPKLTSDFYKRLFVANKKHQLLPMFAKRKSLHNTRSKISFTFLYYQLFSTMSSFHHNLYQEYIRAFFHPAFLRKQYVNELK